MKKYLIILLLLSHLCTIGQNKLRRADTLILKMSLSNYSLKTYKKHLGLTRKSYTLTLTKAYSEQDKIFFQDLDTFYFKLYDKKGRLIEGLKESSNINGKVKYYDNRGSLIKIEFWDRYPTIDTCGISIGYSDGTVPLKVMFYNNSPNPTRCITYTYKVDSCNPQTTHFDKEIIDYDKNGNVKKTTIERKTRIE